MKVVSREWLVVSKFFLFLLVSLSFVSSNSAQTGRINVAEQTALVTEFDVNGLKVLIKRRQSAPTVAVGLFIRGGAQNITDKNAGIENLMLNVATEGGKKFPREALRRELASTGSSVGSSVSNDYSVLSMVSTRRNFDRSWDVFTDIALNPAFAAEDLELTREKILTTLRDDEDNPDGFLQVLQDRVIYAKHPYSNNVRGTIDNIRRFTAADLRAYHQKTLQNSQLLLVIVGDLNAGELQKRITDSFGRLPRGNYKAQSLPALNFAEPTLDITSRPTLPTNYIQGVFNAPALDNPDYYAMRVAAALLRDRVFEEVRVKRNLSYAPSADLGSLASNTANIYVTAVDANQAISVMLKEINNLKQEAVNPDEISGVSGQFLTNYYLGQETNVAQAAELARYELTGGGWRNSFEFLNKVREVKSSDVQRVADKYMKNLRFIVLGNPTAINRQIFLQK